MTLHNSTTSAFQQVLRGFSFPKGSYDFPEAFAQARYLKKFQEPTSKDDKAMKEKCFVDWLSYDVSLARIKTSGFISYPSLYKARHDLQNRLGRPRLNGCTLPTGSEFFTTLGQNSIESRLLRSTWSCTSDCFEMFAKFVWECKAMKRAFRQRYTKWYRKSNFRESMHAMDKYIFRRYRDLGVANPAWECFVYKLGCITTITQGSRFSSVPKNNDTRRPINIENFGNMVVQRQIGDWIRAELYRLYGVDLDVLANTQRTKIQSAQYATIDLKNASDSITLALCQFLLPKRLFDLLIKSRSEYVLGHDRLYHKVEKISSMGNGFTFELMTLILTAIARTFDETATVFGDDIIVKNEVAESLIKVLEGVGFHVNKDKSFINSPFRESCGANYHDEFGYIESFDFRWPENIHDCVVFFNKALRLSKLYPSFGILHQKLRRHIPKALHGVVERDFFTSEIPFKRTTDDVPALLSGHFRTHDHEDFRPSASPGMRQKLAAFAARYNYELKDLKVFNGVTFNETTRSPSLKILKLPKDFAKYEMYLFAGRVAKDVLTGKGNWVDCAFLSVAGSTTRWTDSALE